MISFIDGNTKRKQDKSGRAHDGTYKEQRTWSPEGDALFDPHLDILGSQLQQQNVDAAKIYSLKHTHAAKYSALVLY